MNVLDLLILLLVGLAAVSGFRRGAALQLITYLGLFLGLFLGALIAPRVAPLAQSPVTQAILAMIVLFALAGLGDALGWLVGSRVWVAARRSAFGEVDAAAGSFVSVVALLLAIWFVGLNLVNGPIPSVSRQIRGSAVIRQMDRLLPAPPAILAQARQFLNRFGFPEVFAGIPPAPAGPVRGPTAGQARAAALAAQGSTVRIVGEACGAIQEGSGFVVDSNYLVTNAHVVAGVDTPTVQIQNGGSQRATPVLFDPKLDVAILRVETSPGPGLVLDGEEEDRGTGGAVLGYPGGGDLTVGPAAVRRELSPIGRDIYGRSVVQRDVYELQTVVRPGNSGGPFVLTDGEVAGVVFAASTTDPQVGYALTSTEVIPLVTRADGRTQSVSTGDCVR